MKLGFHMDLESIYHRKIGIVYQNNQFDIRICNHFLSHGMLRRSDMDLDRIHLVLSHNALRNSLEDIHIDITGLWEND